MSEPRIVRTGFTPRRWQDEVLRAMKRFSILAVHRRGGKTCLACNLLIDAALKRRGLYAYVAPQLLQAKRTAWPYLCDYTRPIGVNVNNTVATITFPNGSKIALLSGDDPDTMRGLGLSGVVLDEFADHYSHTWSQIVRPALADAQGWALIIGTPRGTDAFASLYFRALTDPDWYAARYPHTATGVLPDDEIEQARKEMSEAQFALEFLVDFTASSEDTLISLPLARGAAERVLEPSSYSFAPKVLGVDVARFGDDCSVVLRRRGRKTFGYRILHGADLMQVAGLVAKEIDTWGPDAIFVDAGGVGGGVIDRLSQLNHDVLSIDFGGKAPHPRFQNMRAYMWWEMKDWLPRASIPNDETLLAQLTGVRYAYATGDGRIKLESKADLKKRGMPSPDIADALACTFAYSVGTRETHERNRKARYEYDPIADPEDSPPRVH